MAKQKQVIKSSKSERLRMRGVFSIRVIHKDRGLLFGFEQNNLIVDLGYDTMRQRLSTPAPNLEVTKVGYGIGTVAPDPGDTGITSGYIKALDGVTYPDTNKVRFEWSLDFTEFNGNNVSEFALFSEDGTTIFARVTRAPIAKDSSIRLEGTWTIIF